MPPLHGMCGRYTHKLSWKQIVELYRLTFPDEPPENFRGESYNVAPTDIMPVVRPAGNGRELVMARWGLVPWWSSPAQAAKPAYSTINARDDRIRTAPAFREAFKSRRCIVPASGWYEWQKIDARRKQPFHFQPEATPFAFGGVLDVWKGNDRQIVSFAIVTTRAAPGTAAWHDRMPLVLEESQFEDWMRQPSEDAAAMMRPYEGALDVWPVPAAVGNVRNNGPELMERLPQETAGLPL